MIRVTTRVRVPNFQGLFLIQINMKWPRKTLCWLDPIDVKTAEIFFIKKTTRFFLIIDIISVMLFDSFFEGL